MTSKLKKCKELNVKKITYSSYCFNSTISGPPSAIGREETFEETKPNGQQRFVTFASDRPPPPTIQSGFGSSMKRWGIHGFMSTVDAAFGKHSNLIGNRWVVNHVNTIHP